MVSAIKNNKNVANLYDFLFSGCIWTEAGVKLSLLPILNSIGSKEVSFFIFGFYYFTKLESRIQISQLNIYYFSDSHLEHSLGQVPVVFLGNLCLVGRSLEGWRVIIDVTNLHRYRGETGAGVVWGNHPQVILRKHGKYIFVVIIGNYYIAWDEFDCLPYTYKNTV